MVLSPANQSPLQLSPAYGLMSFRLVKSPPVANSSKLLTPAWAPPAISRVALAINANRVFFMMVPDELRARLLAHVAGHDRSRDRIRRVLADHDHADRGGLARIDDLVPAAAVAGREGRRT